MSTAERSFYRRTTDFVSCRQVLNLMVILGFMLNYALRVNLTIAIVAMVQKVVDPAVSTTTISTITDMSTEISNLTDFLVSTTDMIMTNLSDIASNITTDITLEATPPTISEGKFQWTAYEQGFIHGSFYWGYILTELPGGRLAELVGGRRVFGHSMLWASVLTIITPFAANLSYTSLIIVRILLGFMLGASWPAIHPMTAVWIPPMDRSKFMSNMMASSLGAAITMPVCGYLISSWGWASSFYVTGGIGLFWSILWFIVIFETPATHPRISQAERKEIEDAIGSSTSKTRPTYVPWKSIFTSGPVWAIILTHGASVFGYFTVVQQLPTFMNFILHFDIKQNGALSSLPYLGKYIMAISASYLADHLRKTGKLTTTMARKLFTTFAVFTPGVVMIAQVFLGYNRVWSVVLLTTALTLNGAVTAGYLGNGLDIAPNFSGTIFGMANTLSSLGGFLSTVMVGALTDNNQTYGQWQIVFGILAATYIFGSVIFATIGSGELQPWNTPPEKIRSLKDTEEAVPLKNKPAAITS